MDGEKPASKGHGFFALFDWGKKSKKRLFVGSTGSSPNLSKKICNRSPVVGCLLCTRYIFMGGSG